MTKVSECDNYDCIYNSWRVYRQMRKDPHRLAKRRHTCSRVHINISDGKCGDYKTFGR